jgi:hypothetical protein
LRLADVSTPSDSSAICSQGDACSGRPYRNNPRCEWLYIVFSTGRHTSMSIIWAGSSRTNCILLPSHRALEADLQQGHARKHQQTFHPSGLALVLLSNRAQGGVRVALNLRLAWMHSHTYHMCSYRSEAVTIRSEP